MSLRLIGWFFDRFKNLKTPKEYKKEIIQKTIQKYSGVVIKSSKIEIQNNIIFLKISPLYKNEIFLHQEEIKESLKKEGLHITRIF